MKLLGLHLIAYGPFTDVRLDFTTHGVHVVYGKNEAGKSTALRAVTGLLYGIAKSTPDAHLHKMPDLRIGGRFALPDGGSIDLVRRKGKDNTLLDREGRPVDEALLRRLLGGISEEQFSSTFGLDHETLRRGGEAILVGEGRVGESLFGAAVAGGEVHRLLRELRVEADALFTPKAHTRPLNEALKAWSNAQKDARDASMSPESILEQQRHLEDLRGERAECETRRQRLSIERQRLARAQRALPILSKQKALVERRRAMKDVVLLPADATADRIEQLRAIGEARAEVARLTATIADLEGRRARLSIPEELVRFEEPPLDLADRLGGHRKAQEGLPKIEAEIAELEAQALNLLRLTGRAERLEDAARWRVDPRLENNVGRLALEKADLLRATQQTQKALEDRRGRRSALLARRSAVPAAADVRALKKVVIRAERDGALDERLAKLTAQATRVERRALAELSSLGLTGVSLDAAVGLPVPPPEAIDRFGREWAAFEREDEHLQKQEAELEARAQKLTRDMAALELGGHVPTERDLEAAREERQKAWELVSRSLVGRPRGKASPTGAGELTDRFETSMRAADDIADRLRREAERVGKLAALLADRDAVVERRSLSADKSKELSARRERQQGEWHALWHPCAITPRPPPEMKAWLAGHAALVRSVEELRAAQADVSAARTIIASHRAPIVRLLEAEDSLVPEGLASLLDLAHEKIESAETAARERDRVEQELADVDEQLRSLEIEARDQERRGELLRIEWERALTPFGLHGDTTPEEAAAVVGALGQMFHKLEQAETARRRTSSIARDAEAFARDVDLLAREHAPELVGRPAAAAAADLLERYHRGQRDAAERRELDRQLKATSSAVHAQRERLQAAEARVVELLRAAGAGNLAALEEAERASAEARELDEKLTALVAELEELGLFAPDAAAELEGLDVDAATARLEEVEAEIDEVHDHERVIENRIGATEEGLKQLEAPRAKAADAALDAEAALANARAIAERYIRVRIAAVALSREIERYRLQNQGPIVLRASEVFRRLTLGSFAGLRTDFDEKDQPVLLGVRAAGGQDVRVDGMSDGTRDQLYLALRLATLERLAENGDPMPLVVDDILIHFDDDRARAALELLGELSTRTQILFFTHHARLVDLARDAIPKERLNVRELPERTGTNGVSQRASSS